MKQVDQTVMMTEKMIIPLSLKSKIRLQTHQLQVIYLHLDLVQLTKIGHTYVDNSIIFKMRPMVSIYINK